jgi:hypothetical protein
MAEMDLTLAHRIVVAVVVERVPRGGMDLHQQVVVTAEQVFVLR